MMRDSWLRNELASESTSRHETRFQAYPSMMLVGRFRRVGFRMAVAVVMLVSAAVGMSGSGIDGVLGRRPAEQPLQPAAEQGHQDEGGHTAQLPPEIGDKSEERVIRQGSHARPGLGGDEHQQQDR